MKMIRMGMAVLVAAALAACGSGSGVGAADSGPGTGSLDVLVHGATSADVESVWVALRDPADVLAPRNFELTNDAGWKGAFKNIATGTYTAQAFAFDHDTVGATDDGHVGDDFDFENAAGMIFRSVPVTIEIKRLETTVVHFILHEIDENEDLTPPHIGAVTFDKGDVEQWETLNIEVTATNANTLRGLGRNAAGPGNGQGWFVDTATLDANWWDGNTPAEIEANIGASLADEADISSGTATLDWAPEPVQGDQTIVLEVEDAAGNRTRVTFTIEVGGNAAEFTVAFNHSPAVTVEDIFSDIQDGESSITFTVNATDVNDPAEVTHTRMSYDLDSDCGGNFTGAASGDFDPVTLSETFTYTAITPADSCTIEITVTNWVENEDGVEDSIGASTVYTLILENWAWDDFQVNP